MNKQFRFVLIIALLLSLGLTGCERSASKAVVDTPAATGEIPFPLPSVNPLKVIPTVLSTAATGANTPAAGDTQPAAPAAGATATIPPLVLPSDTPVPVVPTVAPTFAVIPTATPGLPATYTLHAGEWPYCIARRFNIEPSAFLAANGLDVNSRPAEGTEVKIPSGTAGWTSGSRALIDHPAVYTVKPGDTIYSVACDFGDADPNAIIAANKLTEPYDLNIGQTIQVP
jgi:LysM repeat protein